MSFVLEPGTYRNDIPATDGHLTALVRCPSCLEYWHVDQQGKPEVCKNRPFLTECMSCDTVFTATPGELHNNAEVTKPERKPAVRRRNRREDCPLFGDPARDIQDGCGEAKEGVAGLGEPTVCEGEISVSETWDWDY